jgi:hypothetical protein
MSVTKQYLFILLFDAGSAELSDEISTESLRQAVWRAQGIPEHRIAIEAHEDRADSRDVGMAMRRLAALQSHFLTESVPEERLEMQTHTGNCCEEVHGEFARRVEIHLFPRVPSHYPDVGEPFLTYRELQVRQSAWEAVIFHDSEKCKQFEEKYTRTDWKRIVGYDSLREWVEEGLRIRVPAIPKEKGARSRH